MARVGSLSPSTLTWITWRWQQKRYHITQLNGVLWNKSQSVPHVPSGHDDQSAPKLERTEAERVQPVTVIEWHWDQCNRNAGGSRGLGKCP